MQLDYAKRQLPNIDKHARNAAQLCHDSRGVPDDLVSCIDELEREAGQVAAMANDEQMEPKTLIERVDHMEELGDRAMQACRQASPVDEQVQQAVETVHGAISELKHRLH